MKNYGFDVILNICFFMTAIMLNKNFEATIGNKSYLRRASDINGML